VSGIPPEDLKIWRGMLHKPDGVEVQTIKLAGKNLRALIPAEPNAKVFENKIPIGAFALDVHIPTRIMHEKLEPRYKYGILFIKLNKDLLEDDSMEVEIQVGE